MWWGVFESEEVRGHRHKWSPSETALRPPDQVHSVRNRTSQIKGRCLLGWRKLPKLSSAAISHSFVRFGRGVQKRLSPEFTYFCQLFGSVDSCAFLSALRIFILAHLTRFYSCPAPQKKCSPCIYLAPLKAWQPSLTHPHHRSFGGGWQSKSLKYHSLTTDSLGLVQGVVKVKICV